MPCRRYWCPCCCLCVPPKSQTGCASAHTQLRLSLLCTNYQLIKLDRENVSDLAMFSTLGRRRPHKKGLHRPANVTQQRGIYWLVRRVATFESSHVVQRDILWSRSGSGSSVRRTAKSELYDVTSLCIFFPEQKIYVSAQHFYRT